MTAIPRDVTRTSVDLHAQHVRWQAIATLRDPESWVPVRVVLRHRRLMEMHVAYSAYARVGSAAEALAIIITVPAVTHRRCINRCMSAMFSGLSRMDYQTRQTLLEMAPRTLTDREGAAAFWNTFKIALAEARRTRAAQGRSRCG